MAYQGIGTGTTPNDNTGDSLFTGAVKINSNFSEIYNALGDGSNINLSKNRTITAGSGLTGGGNLNADITLNIGQGDGISVSADSIAVDNTVIRTSGGQSIAGSLSINNGSFTVTGGSLSIDNGSIADASTDFRIGGYGWIDFHNRLSVGSYNPIIQGNDKGIIFSDITGVEPAAPTGNFVIAPWSNSTSGIRITSSGNLGVGVANPTEKLVVSNNISLGTVVSGATATPTKLETGNNYSNGTTKDKCKLYLYNSGTDQYGFGVGSSGDIQYHSNTIHDFYINNANIARVDSSGILINGNTVWHQGNDGTGSGLDADLLDGIDSSRIVFGGDATKTTLNINWNDALSSGFYNQFGPSGEGTPTETWYHMIGCRHPNTANNYQMQISGDIFDVNNLYYRIINNNNPTSWYKIWHSGNMGAGSGLVADSVNIVGAADVGNWYVPLVADSGNQTPRIDSGITYSAPSNSLAIGGGISAGGNIINGGFDFILGNSNQNSRGNSGASRALVKDANSTLVLNYAGDFTGGVRIDSTVTATNAFVSGITTGGGFNATTGNTYQINGTSVLSNNTLGTGVVNSSLTSVGTLGSLNVTGTTTLGFVTATTFSGNGTIPLGGIIMWNGSVAPTGWALCDGQNGTPDLRDRFIVGATTGGDIVYPGVGVGQTGGSADAIVVSHSHTPGIAPASGGGFTISNPNGPNTGNFALTPAAATSAPLPDGEGYISTSTSTEGISGTNENLPPYYALAFIMRVA